jgi:hypothetical protein
METKDVVRRHSSELGIDKDRRGRNELEVDFALEIRHSPGGREHSGGDHVGSRGTDVRVMSVVAR